jgi:hypothetical protein
MQRRGEVDKSTPLGNFIRSSGAIDSIYSPFDTPETASDGVILFSHAY